MIDVGIPGLQVNDNGEIVGYSGDKKYLCVDDQRVVAVLPRAFEGNSDLVAFSAPHVKVVGGYAFKECSHLSMLALPKLEWVGNEAFYDCEQLSPRFSAMPNLTFIGRKAFAFTAATVVDLSNAKLKRIYDEAFANMKNLDAVMLPNGLKAIGSAAFYMCQNLRSVAWPDGLKLVGDSAFDSCASLKSFEPKAGLEEIGERAFAECESLKDIYIPHTVKEVGANAFYRVDDYAVIKCESLEWRKWDAEYSNWRGLLPLAPDKDYAKKSMKDAGKAIGEFADAFKETVEERLGFKPELLSVEIAYFGRNGCFNSELASKYPNALSAALTFSKSPDGRALMDFDVGQGSTRGFIHGLEKDILSKMPAEDAERTSMFDLHDNAGKGDWHASVSVMAD